MKKQTTIAFFLFLLMILILETSCKESPTAKVTANLRESQALGNCNLQTSLSVVEIGGQYKICFDGPVLKMDIINNRNKRLEYADITIKGDLGSQRVERSENLGSGAVYKTEAEYDPETVGRIMTVEIVPYLRINDVVTRCESQSLLVDDIEGCW